MSENPRHRYLTNVALPALVALLGLCASLAMGVLAPPDATRVAIVALPGSAAAWQAINHSGLPVVQVLLGGMLVVVDGTGSARQLAVLRREPVILLNARLVPGCTPVETSASERVSDGPDA